MWRHRLKNLDDMTVCNDEPSRVDQKAGANNARENRRLASRRLSPLADESNYALTA
jgi:hypothetical protein